jgi:hypothetical protein
VPVLDIGQRGDGLMGAQHATPSRLGTLHMWLQVELVTSYRRGTMYALTPSPVLTHA